MLLRQGFVVHLDPKGSAVEDQFPVRRRASDFGVRGEPSAEPEFRFEDQDVETFVAEVGGEPIGSVSIGGNFLRTLYVLPAHWRTGVGTALHDHALERLRARGCTRAKLWTLEENWNARHYYEKRDWTLTPETRVVPYPPNPIDVQYAKDL